MVASRGQVIHTHIYVSVIYIYVIYACVCEYAVLGGARGKAMVEGDLKEFTVYACQWFPALLYMQAPTVVLREVGYRYL